MPEKIGNTLVVVLARGLSLRRWAQSGLLDREWQMYARLAPYYERLMVVTWGDARDRQIGAAIPGDPAVVANEANVPDATYEAEIPQRVVDACRGHDPVVIKTNQHKSGRIAADISRKLRECGVRTAVIARGGYPWSRFVAHEHGPDSAEAIAAGSEEETLCVSADIIVGATGKMVDDLAWRYELERARLMVVPNHVLTDVEPEFEDRSEDDVLYVGQLTHRKRVDVLIDAVAALSEGLDRTVTLTVIGDGPLFERLNNQARQVGASVRWVPPQPHQIVLDHMKRCTVYAHASEFEGHPRAVIEAMSMGASVIVADSPGLQSVVEHGVTGLRTDVSAEAFCHVLGGLFFDAEWRQQLGREASSRVRQRYGLSTVLVQEIDVHRRAVDLIGMSGARLRAPVCLSSTAADGDAPSWMAAIHAHAMSLSPDDRHAFYTVLAQSMLQHAA